EESGGLEGTVTFVTTGDPIDSVKVSCGNFVAYTDFNGFYQFVPAPPIGTYNVKFEKTGFVTAWADSVTLGYWVTILDMELYFDGPAPRDLVAEGLHLCIDLTWRAPELGGVTQVEYVLDDGSYENGWTGNPGYELWFGNLFPVDDTGELISFDLYTEFNAAAGSDLLEIDIFDAAHNLVGSSESFVPIPDTWTTISCPNVPFDGEFYAMIHYNYESAQSHWMGFDENGPNANAGLDWYTDGTTWALLHVIAGADPGVFMLRATAMVQGELTEITVGDVNYNQSALPEDEITSIRNSVTMNNFNNPQYIIPNNELDSYEVTILNRDLVLEGYNVYREDLVPDTLDYIPIEEPRYYRDEIVAVNVEYTYWVTAVYTVGESGESNHASAIPIILGIEDFEADDGGFVGTGEWQWGIPTSGPGNAHSGVKLWATNLSGNYMNNANYTLDSPETEIVDPIFAFWHYYDIESYYDGGNIKISTDGGATWTLIYPEGGYPEDAASSANAGIPGEPCYSGNSGGWVLAVFDVSAYVGEIVYFRWHFGSDSSVQYPGWYIDDVRIGFGIEPEYGALQGTVTDPDGIPIEDAQITVMGELHPFGRYTVETDPFGYYEIDPIIAQFYDFTCECFPYYTVEDTFTVFPDSTLVYDVVMGIPEIVVTPPSVTITLNPDTQGEEILTVSNPGTAPLDWHASIVVYGTARIQMPTTTIEIEPYKPVYSKQEFASLSELVTSVGFTSPYQRDFGDIVEQWSSPDNSPMGLDWDPDDDFIWHTSENAPGNCLYKIDIETHAIIASYPTPNPFGMSEPNLNGICVVGDYLYLTDYQGDLTVVDDYIQQVDKYDFTVIDTWEVDPTIDQILGITYRDPYFYIVCNTASLIYEVDLQPGGTFDIISTIPSPTGGALTGIHYLPYTVEGPTFWMTSLAANLITKTDEDFNVIASAGGPVGESIFGITWPGEGENFWLDGFSNAMMYIIDGDIDASVISWIWIEPTSGTVPAGSDSLVTVFFDAIDQLPGTILTADIHFFSNAPVDDPIIPATLEVYSATGDLDGTVTDAGTGAPMDSVFVTALGAKYTTYTDTTGYYLFEAIPTGMYNLTFEYEFCNIGFVDSVEIFENQTTTVNYAMTAPELIFTPNSFEFEIRIGEFDTDTLAVENVGTGPVDFSIDIHYITKNRQDSILCVDRDGSSSAAGYTDDWPYFEAALIAAGYTDYTHYDVVDLTQDGPDLATMQAYEVIIWFSGEAWGYYGHDCMTDNDEINLGIYLEGGGSLFLSAHDYLWASYPSAGPFSAGQFPYDYLGMRSVVQDNWLISLPNTGTVEGVAGSLAEGYVFDVHDIYTTDKEGLWIDWFTDHVGVDLFNVTSPAPEGICANQYDDDEGMFRTVFTTASFAAIIDPSIQSTLINAIIVFLTSGMPHWLTVEPMSGTINSFTTTELLVTANAEELEVGEYDATITVNTENPDIGPTIIDVHLEVTIESVEEIHILSTKLNSNFPNPFSNSTTISFSLKEKSHVKLSVYNIKGQLVATLINGMMNPVANHEIVWNGMNGRKQLANGIYFYRFDTKEKSFIKKMILLR
ncbi:MAG: carboxypeptidase regulatory-like domain-containing protein, partial [Candidatus Cloacimonetes bacterium]|nr:carboxypeptidase regulatory-like domain-containing protein [Candidatus Cloacimonadota bacterium]